MEGYRVEILNTGAETIANIPVGGSLIIGRYVSGIRLVGRVIDEVQFETGDLNPFGSGRFWGSGTNNNTDLLTYSASATGNSRALLRVVARDHNGNVIGTNGTFET